MGAWGTGLYSSDMAADMRATIKSVLRLPFDEDRIVDVLRESEPGTADNPDNEDYTTFWLVIADQFEKRGVAHAPTRDKALAIIDRGDDLAMMERRGMKLADLRKRGAKLAELRARLASASRISKPRATMTEPEPYVLELGVLYACPVRGCNPINPYLSKKHYEENPWSPDGWRQFVILDRGRAFDYLAWYQPLVCKKPVKERPSVARAEDDLWWQLEWPKTCPRGYSERLGIVPIGELPIDMDKARARFQRRRPGIMFLGWGGKGSAIHEVTLGDTMHRSSHDWDLHYEPKGRVPDEGPTMMRSLSELLSAGVAS